jgi:hypothetical protein
MESLVSDIPAGDVKTVSHFLPCNLGSYVKILKPVSYSTEEEANTKTIRLRKLLKLSECVCE